MSKKSLLRTWTTLFQHNMGKKIFWNGLMPSREQIEITQIKDPFPPDSPILHRM